jgi:hypothetical protein
MEAVIWTAVQALSVTPTAISDANLGGANIAGNSQYQVYVWSDANFRVLAPGVTALANGATITANKWHSVGLASTVRLCTFASISATPDMRIMVTRGSLHGV